MGEQLDNALNDEQSGLRYSVYGDGAYKRQNSMAVQQKVSPLTAAQVTEGTEKPRSRVTVEQFFGEVSRL